MYKISNDTSDNYTTLVDIITEHDLSGCSVLETTSINKRFMTLTSTLVLLKMQKVWCLC